MFTENINTAIQFVGEMIDIAGVFVVVSGIVVATIVALYTLVRHKRALHEQYRSYRQNLARSVLVGLEFLVAGDIIRSVAGNLTLTSVYILAIIVAIRMVLGMSLEMEIEGRWPWNQQKSTRKS